MPITVPFVQDPQDLKRLSAMLPDGRQLVWSLGPDTVRLAEIDGSGEKFQLFPTHGDYRALVLKGEVQYILAGQVRQFGTHEEWEHLTFVVVRNGIVRHHEGHPSTSAYSAWGIFLYEVEDGMLQVMEEEHFKREPKGVRVTRTVHSFIPDLVPV